MPETMKVIIKKYIEHIKDILGEDYVNAVLYGSCARDEYSEESDVDIAIFTGVSSGEFYKLADKIAEITFEYSVRYDVILSPVFVNVEEYRRMIKVMPFYQSIREEGIAIG